MPDLPKFRSFFASVQFQARLNPHAIAVVAETQTLSYAEFAARIDGVTRRLASLALAAGMRAAVQVQDPLLRWLTLAALARLGVVSASAANEGELRLIGADILITDQAGTAQGAKLIQIGDDWLDPVADSLPPFNEVPHDPQAPCRIVLSSGTTGTPKKALMTYGQLRTRYRSLTRTYGLNTATRLTVTMGTASVGGYVVPITCWAGGGAVLLAPVKPGRPASDLLRMEPNVFMSPAQLAGLVASLPADYWPWQRLTAYVAGSELTPALSRRTRMRLTEALFIVYGSTEAGTVTLAHASGADGRPGFSGWVVPTAELQVVDEQGRPVPNGTIGEIRVRADGMVDGYVDDPDASGEAFRDGWFYPGDSGTLTDDHALVIQGRTRELMNLNGVKIAPSLIDQALAETPGVTDLAVFAWKGSAGTQPAVAVVAGEGFDLKRLGLQYRKAFPKLPALMVTHVASIPRNEMGKVMRAQLAATVREAMVARQDPADRVTDPPA